jgi:hypothetical protein
MQQENEARQAELDELLRKKRQALVRQRVRATESDNEWKRWASGFDIERLSKEGGLIEFFEIRPFIDCETVEEYLHSARLFARAFRAQDDDVPDIQPSETINDFIRRVHERWYSPAPGQMLFFVRLATAEFDDDCGFKRSEPWDYSSWTPVPGSEVSLTAEEIAALPRMKELPQWKKEGFSNYADWKTDFDKKECKRQNHEILESSLRPESEIDRDLNKTPTDETKTTQLLYSGTINEH